MLQKKKKMAKRNGENMPVWEMHKQKGKVDQEKAERGEMGQREGKR